MKSPSRFLLYTFLIGLITWQSCNQQPAINLLVFSKTEGFRHESIEAGKTALDQMAGENGFNTDFSEDASVFTERDLKKYHAVIFLNTTGDILNAKQQEAFERYIQAGGGYVGIHSATDTEYEWPWYGKLAGAWFLDHPSDPSNVQTGTFHVVKKNHWATQGMPNTFERTDEFYSFKNISKEINVLITIDENTYQGGSNPEYHPMSWYHDFDGGRAFYTAMGHTNETYSEPLFLNHLLSGIKYATGGEQPVQLDFTKSKPEENRFSKVVLADQLDEPMELTLLDENRVLFIQRKGEVMLYNNLTGSLKEIAKIPVSTHYVSAQGEERMGEDGLMGLNKDPDFKNNHWVYLFYSTTKKPANVLSRFEMKGDELLLESEKIMLEIPVQREECCHTGGSIAWDKDGNLYLSTGDNTNPHGSNGYSPSDERPGRESWDAQKSSANTNDLRGKIIRITPQPDGSYTIPEGNLFAKGTDKTRPEIYTMGHRNPFRISVDQKTGYVYWGDVGPDADKPDSLRGPAGHDEVGQARKSGNYGWPHFVGDNKAYFKYDFEAEKSLFQWDPEAPFNTSPNNTGLEELPPAQKAFIWYPYGESPEFPLVGTGSRNAMAGPVYYVENFDGEVNAFPKYYDKKLFTYDWMRGWIMAVTMDKEGNFVGMERFMPSHKFSNPMDMAFAENGDLYMLEYGTGWFSANDDARLIRINYNGGNRKPNVLTSADHTAGAVPLDIQLSADGTTDADEDKLSYQWVVKSQNEAYSETFESNNVNIVLDKPGVYHATLSVDDGNGGVVTSSFDITAGNEPPEVTLKLSDGNRSFYMPNQTYQYSISVSDKEDGTIEHGINPDQVVVSIDYLAEGFDAAMLSQGESDQNEAFSRGKTMLEESDCRSCHAINKKSIGPSYMDVANRYKNSEDAVTTLAGKIISGGSGVWGETAMAAHPDFSQEEAEEMVKYILSLKNDSQVLSLPATGKFTATVPEDDKGTGVFLFRASYEDLGANGLPSAKTTKTYALRNNNIKVHHYDIYQDVMKMSFEGNDLLIISKSGAYVGLKKLDLNNLSSLTVMATAPIPRLGASGGMVEIRIDNPDGPLIGSSENLEPSEEMSFKPSVLNIGLDLESVDTKDVHDLYLVFKNKDNSEGSVMVVLATIYNIE